MPLVFKGLESSAEADSRQGFLPIVGNSYPLGIPTVFTPKFFFILIFNLSPENFFSVAFFVARFLQSKKPSAGGALAKCHQKTYEYRNQQESTAKKYHTGITRLTTLGAIHVGSRSMPLLNGRTWFSS